MKPLRALGSEFQKVFTTRMWWLLALLLVAYVAFLAGGLGAFLGWTIENPEAAENAGNNTATAARHGARAADLQLRVVGGLRLPGAARRPRGDGRVPAQDAHADVPGRAAPVDRALGEVRLATRGGRRTRRDRVRHVGRRRRCRPRGLRPRHRARLERHLGAHRARRAGDGALGRDRRRPRRARHQPGRRDRHRDRVHPVRRADPATRGVAQRRHGADRPVPAGGRERRAGRGILLQHRRRSAPRESLEWWQGGLVLLAIGVIATVVGGATTWRRDVS